MKIDFPEPPFLSRLAAVLSLFCLLLTVLGVVVGRAFPAGAVLTYVVHNPSLDIEEAYLYAADLERRITEPLFTVGSTGAPILCSPDSRYLASDASIMTEGGQVGYTPLVFGIYVTETRTGKAALIRITDTPSVFPIEYTWSPNSQQLAYLWLDEALVSHINLVNPDDSGEHEIAQMEGYMQNLAWSSDGQQIAYIRVLLDQILQTVSYQLYVMNTDGTEVRLLSGDINSVSTALWSPDGQQIAFLTDTENEDALYVVDIQTGVPRLLAENLDPYGLFAWSPDGRQIAFFEYTVGFDGLSVVDADTGSVRSLAGNVAPYAGLAWSPDSQQIAFGSIYPADIYRIAATGGSSFNLTNEADDAYAQPDYQSLTWSPDGSRLALIAYWRGEMRIFSVNADGSDPREVAAYPQSAHHGSLSWWQPQ